jgi:chitosanase
MNAEAKRLGDAELDFIRRILSVAECGRPEFPFSEVYIYADDNRFKPARRQITYSIGFTEGGGNLKKVLLRYVDAGGALAKDIQPFTVGLGDQNRGSLCGNQAFVGLLKVAGQEQLMRKVQREQFDVMYLNPAIKWGEQYGFTLALSFLTIADSYLHSGSMLGFLMAKFPEKKPNAGGDEKKWITDYLSARRQWLANHENKVLNKTVYRANCFLIEASKGNWDLQTAVVMNGKTVARVA